MFHRVATGMRRTIAVIVFRSGMGMLPLFDASCATAIFGGANMTEQIVEPQPKPSSAPALNSVPTRTTAELLGKLKKLIQETQAIVNRVEAKLDQLSSDRRKVHGAAYTVISSEARLARARDVLRTGKPETRIPNNELEAGIAQANHAKEEWSSLERRIDADLKPTTQPSR